MNVFDLWYLAIVEVNGNALNGNHVVDYTFVSDKLSPLFRNNMHYL